MQNYGCRRFAALLIKKCSLQSREFVGNGLDRSGIGILTSTLYKIRIEYNTLRLKPEQASLFPTPTFQVSSIPNYLNSNLKTLHS